MTKVAPFKAVIYNQEKIRHIREVVCPPYDVISPNEQEYYHNLDPHNFIRVLLTRDATGEDKYKIAAERFNNWLKEQVLISDSAPAFYFYSQQYYIKGEKRNRYGFIGLLRLEDDNSRVFGHEHTRLEPKEDRLRLIRKVKANLSPIFAVFGDKHRIISGLQQHCGEGNRPFIELTDQQNVTHRLWRIDSQEMVRRIQDKISDENIFIADGHHRYEVACNFREEMRKKLGSITGDESFNYILCYFTNTRVPDLTVLPIHRLINFPTAPDIEKLKNSLQEYFDLEEIKDKTKFFFLLQKAGNTEHVIGMYHCRRFYLLRLKNIRILDKVIQDKQKEYRLLDVSVFNYLILKKILDMDIEDKKNIIFNHDAQELLGLADSSDSSIAFILNPAKINQIMAIALSGEKMPSKSTFFYPKVLSGLLVHKFF